MTLPNSAQNALYSSRCPQNTASAPAPAQGVVLGPTNPQDVQKLIQQLQGGYQAQIAGWIGMIKILEDLAQQQPGDQKIQKLLQYAKASAGRLQQLVKTANAPPNQVAQLIKNFNAATIRLLNGKVGFLKGLVAKKMKDGNDPAGLVSAQKALAAAEIDLANAQATDQAGGIVLTDPLLPPAP